MVKKEKIVKKEKMVKNIRSKQKCVACGKWVRRLIWTHDSEGVCIKCAREKKINWVEVDGEWYA